MYNNIQINHNSCSLIFLPLLSFNPVSFKAKAVEVCKQAAQEYTQ